MNINKKFLVINTGSSSVKFKLYSQEKKELAWGICERIFIDGNFEISYYDSNQELSKKNKNLMHFDSKKDFPNHDVAISFFLSMLIDLKIINDLSEISGVGHRVVQGGNLFLESKIINSEVEMGIEKLIPLAPIHNKPELDVIRILNDKLPNAKSVASFDSAFHGTIPELNSTYAIPESWRKDFFIKRYGAHGLSYKYITDNIEKILKKDSVNIIVCHLGNGASVCAIKNSNSANTSMGLTPLEGLIMGTRCGDIDPSIHKYISVQKNLSLEEVDNILHKESGLKGLCGYSDFRDIRERALAGNKYQFAIDIFAKKITDYIVKYLNDLENKIDAIVFTGGIGENDYILREQVIQKIKIGKFSISINSNKKKFDSYQKISGLFSKKIYVMKTNEELVILNDVLNLIK